MKSFKLRKTLARVSAVATALAVASTALLAVTFSSPGNASALSFGGPFDCDGNAVIYCGAPSTSSLQNSFNSSQTIRDIYSYFNIGSTQINNDLNGAVAGQVTKSGDVVVNGQVVATNAITAGRSYIAGSTKAQVGDTIFYTRSPSVSFLNDQLSAYVVMNNGVFQFAVLSSCGNPVSAHATQQQQKPQPSLVCNTLQATKESDTEYKFVVNATGQNVTNVSYTVNFGDGSTNYTGASNSVSHTYAEASQANNFTATASVSSDQIQNVTSPGCAASVTIPQQIQYCKPGVPVGSSECQTEQQMCTVPGKTNYPVGSAECVTTTTTVQQPPTQLVQTGPSDIIGIFAVTSAVAAIGSRLFLKRRHQA